jgi:hypothetical protein
MSQFPPGSLLGKVGNTSKVGGLFRAEIIKKLLSKSNDAAIQDAAWLLFDQALLLEGVPLRDPATFVQARRPIHDHRTVENSPNGPKASQSD